MECIECNALVKANLWIVRWKYIGERTQNLLGQIGLVISLARSFTLWLLFEKWLWIIICGCILILLAPFVILSAILILPEGVPRLTAGLSIVIGSGIAGGVKEWYLYKSKEEEKWYARAKRTSRPS